jgi:hypothetical protein
VLSCVRKFLRIVPILRALAADRRELAVLLARAQGAAGAGAEGDS